MKSIGPGLLFASTSIGTSHLVLSTRAGAHHGMIYLWIILGILLLKYPFYEFSPRYTNATGYSLLKSYKDQGMWAVWLFFLVICVNMIAVVGAIGAVSAGLLSTMLGMGSISMPLLLIGVLTFTAAILIIGGYTVLDNFVKFISIVLLVSVGIAFIAVIYKGPIQPDVMINSVGLLEGAGLTLLVGLIGFMPSGMESSTMYSFWVVEKMRSSNYHPSLKESLFDFRLGYWFTVGLAIMFVVIGSFTVFGSGTQLTDTSATAFSNKLLNIFTVHLGEWSYAVIALAAFGTIYGTLIAAWDAFARSFIRTLRIFKFKEIIKNKEQQDFLNRTYKIALPLIGLGGFLIFYFSAKSMIAMLELATIIAFLNAPIIAYLNLRAMQAKHFPASHRPAKWMIYFSYIGLMAMVAFAIYYMIVII